VLVGVGFCLRSIPLVDHRLSLAQPGRVAHPNNLRE
jgi:hypothetical protein